MGDDLFLSAGDFQTVTGWVGDYLVFGFTLSCVVWVVGYVVWFIIDVMRGG